MQQKRGLPGLQAMGSCRRLPPPCTSAFHTSPQCWWSPVALGQAVFRWHRAQCTCHGSGKEDEYVLKHGCVVCVVSSCFLKLLYGAVIYESSSETNQNDAYDAHRDARKAGDRKMMPPPTSNAKLPLRQYLASLAVRAHADSKHPCRPSQSSGSVQELKAKVQAWVESMTPVQKARRFTTSEVEHLAQLRGKLGGPAAHHRIAQALRACGFTPRRDWTRAGRNTRFWSLTDREFK